MILKLTALITGIMAFIAVAIISLPLYLFFVMPSGKQWAVYMGEVFNFQFEE